METCRVAQRKDNGPFDVFDHFSNYLLGESVWLGGCSDQDMWLDLLNDGKQVVLFACWPLLVISSKGNLSGSQFDAVGLE